MKTKKNLIFKIAPKEKLKLKILKMLKIFKAQLNLLKIKMKIRLTKWIVIRKILNYVFLAKRSQERCLLILANMFHTAKIVSYNGEL